MHRATPRTTSFRSYVSGGARTTIDEADDSKFMQEMQGGFMKGENRKSVESPQNYGFTSVVSDADKGKDGSSGDSAEGFISFMGGSRSFPVCPVMDDRRHRLWGMEKGDTAMFRKATDLLQTHMNKDGLFHTGPRDKTVRMQLVDKDSGDSQDNQRQGSGANGKLTFFDLMPHAKDGAGVSLMDAGGGGGGGGNGQGGQQQGDQKKGQKPIYKDGQKSHRFVDVTKNDTRLSGTESHLMLEDGDSYVHCLEKKTYLGGHAKKNKFARVITEAGPAKNVWGKIGGGGGGLTTSGPVEQAQVVQPHQTPHPARSALVPALMLLLGLSLGLNYRLLADATTTSTMIASVAHFASR